MQYPKYDLVKDSSVNRSYTFTSRGSIKDFVMAIQFQQTVQSNVYNLGFGVKSSSGSFDDEAVTDNKDRNMILATIAQAVYDFTEDKPESYIFFTGSNAARTRLYRMAISLNQTELETDFIIWGVMMKEELRTEPFNSKGNYYGFLVKRK